MAYDEQLADRVRACLGEACDEQRMFGGLAFLVGGNLAVCVGPADLLVRTGREGYAAALADGAEPMTMGARTMGGHVRVPAELLGGEALAAWVARGVGVAAALPPKTAR